MPLVISLKRWPSDADKLSPWHALLWLCWGFFESLREREQLAREPRPLPQMHLNSAVKDIFEFRFEDFELQNYDPHPAIKAPVAV